MATEALAAVTTEVFLQHGLHRVYAEADDRNVTVHRLFDRLGFRCEARLVEADWLKGEWSTLRVFAVLRREWVNRRPAADRRTGRAIRSGEAATAASSGRGAARSGCRRAA